MSAPKIRADYGSLKTIASRFHGESDSIKQMQTSITQAMGTLEGGDWVGPGASAFYAEMRDSVLPAVQRLVAAFESAGASADKISRTVKQAEDDAARQLRRVGHPGVSEYGVPYVIADRPPPMYGTEPPLPQAQSYVERLPRPAVQASDQVDANAVGDGV